MWREHEPLEKLREELWDWRSTEASKMSKEADWTFQVLEAMSKIWLLSLKNEKAWESFQLMG